ncbi:MAG: indolepyruvate oxidoreductase subunit beta [Desulfohalobiaceae bacterium]|nr:indolepyruvate oxidoreductase subunit beta [Desulfohalobiaceae bacterium]
MQNKRIVFVGVGGQGNLLITRLLGEASLAKGIPALVSEIHGMAQRGGIVESAVVMGNVSSPIVAEGEADILVGFEPMETLRAIGKVRKDGLVLTNTAPLPPFTVSIGQGSYPDLELILNLLRSKVDRMFTLNAKGLAETAGSLQSLNMVLLGGLIGLDHLDIGPGEMKETISSNTKKSFLEANLKAFDLGWEEVNHEVQSAGPEPVS